MVYSPPVSSEGGSGGGNQQLTPDDLEDIGKTKTLTPNQDGTYTMELSVTTHSIPDEEHNGVNLLIVFDTSSSMRRSTIWFENGEGHQYAANEFKNYPDCRFMQTKTALSEFLEGLYENVANPDEIQLALVDFNLLADSNHVFSNGSHWTSNPDAFMQEFSELDCPQGTNWADALKTAIDTSRVPAPENDNPTYVLLMTDGAPSQYWHTDRSYFVSGEACYLAARDEARAVINDGKELYAIFSYGNVQDKNNGYLTKLVNYAYNKDASDHSMYASNTNDLKESLGKVLKVLSAKIAHTGLNYNDGIALDTTSTALNINVSGNLGSIVYSKTGGTSPSYTVVTKRDGTIESFKVGETEYKDSSEITTKDYKKISGGTPESGEITVTDEFAPVYQCTVESGTDKGTYTMPIATLSIDSETNIGDLNWDLSPLGLLENGATYKISFVVWPDQKAYDYVADLNNGTKEWDTTTEEPVYKKDAQGNNTETILYYRKGVASYPNIVRYPGEEPVYAALTNTSQEVTYYIADEINGSGTSYSGQYTADPPTPDPMPLTATGSALEKAWSVDRDPGIMAQLLYDAEGNSTQFKIEYDIIRDNGATPYKSITLGWDKTRGEYVWDGVRTVIYNGHPVPVGMQWSEDFDIATGLMLSETQMEKRGLDKAAYPSGEFPEGSGKIYYILEPGHDYMIKESIPEGETSWVTYEFDFVSPVYHPMLVDGVLRSVNFTGYSEGMTITEPGNDINITDMTDESVSMNSLKVINTLRGYINLEKVVVDKDGLTPVEDDDQKFLYTVDLTNSTEPGPFTTEGSNVPWYGINGLFYHDENWNYYQAETNTPDHKAHEFWLKTESGDEYWAWCTDSDGVFDEDVIGPTSVTYNDGTRNITIQLSGNQMTHDSDNHVHAQMRINQYETLNIANVPVGTAYTITEGEEADYDLVNIVREIRNGTTVESSDAASTVNNTNISGTIKADRDNHITFTNKIHSADITVKKVDENNKPLPGAVFTLTKAKAGDETEDTVFTKPADGDDDTGTYLFADLPDGSYTLREGAPAGYAAVGEMTFTVENGEVKNLIIPEGITRDGDSLTFTVKNQPLENEGEIRVRKQWLDYFGNADIPGAEEIHVTLKRTVDVPQTKNLRIIIVAGSTRREKEVVIDSTAYRLSWYDNGQFQWVGQRVSQTCNDNAITVTDSISTHGNPSLNGNNNNAIWDISNLQNATQDTVVITFTYQNGYNDDRLMDWFPSEFASYVPSSNSINLTNTGTAITSGSGEPVEDDWSEVITLNAANGWNVNKTGLPAADGSGNAYHYYIEEAAIEGYEVTYSENNDEGIQSGILTAYNKKTTPEGSIQINKKVLRNGSLDKAADGTFWYAVYGEPYNAYKPPAPVASGSVAVANGIGRTTVRNLPLGTYYVYELTGEGGVPVTEGVGTVNGIVYRVTGSGSSTTVSETAGVVSLINNHETTDLTVTKDWNDSSSVDHANDTISFKLYQAAMSADDEILAEKEYTEAAYPNSITGSGSVTISDLPLNGIIESDSGNHPVVYRYYVVEEQGKEGYIQAIAHDDSGRAWTITNLSLSKDDVLTQITFTKKWQDKNGFDATLTAHDDDEIQVKLRQRAVDSGYVPVVVQLHGYTGSTISSLHYYVKKGDSISLTTTYGGSLLGLFEHRIALSTSRSNADRQEWSTTSAGSHVFSVSGIEDAITFILRLSTFTDGWETGNTAPSMYDWSCSVSGTDLLDSAEAVAEAVKDHAAVNNDQEYVYQMGKNSISDGPFEESASDWVGMVNGLPLYYKFSEGTYYTYYYYIDEVSINGEPVVGKETSDSITTGYTDDYTVVINDENLTITNKEREKIDADASKAWLNADKTVTPPEGGTVTFELYADGMATGKTVVLDGTTVDEEKEAVNADETLSSDEKEARNAELDALRFGEFAAWKAEWRNLPKYKADGTTPIAYTVMEVSDYTGYTNQNPGGVDALAENAQDRVITNKQDTVSFDILKVDGETSEHLPGARFTIRPVKKTSSTTEPEYPEGSSPSEPVITGDEGRASFTDILPGYYEVLEKDPPAGYVITGDAAFYIKVDTTGVKLLRKVVTGNTMVLTEAEEGEKVGCVSIDTKGTMITFVVENTPGTELPSTGGTGTKFFTIFGAILTVGSGTVLIVRKRRRRKVRTDSSKG